MTTPGSRRPVAHEEPGVIVFTPLSTITSQQVADDHRSRLRRAGRVSRLGRTPVAPELICVTELVDLAQLLRRPGTRHRVAAAPIAATCEPVGAARPAVSSSAPSA